MFSFEQMPSTSAVLSLYTSFTAFAVLIRAVVSEFQAIANQLLPGEILEKIRGLFGNLTGKTILVFDEYNGFDRNEIFEASRVYLSSKLSPTLGGRLRVSRASREKGFSFVMSKGEKITDTFEGVELVWEFVVSESPRTSSDRSSETEEHESFELRFDRKNEGLVFDSYLPFVMERWKEIAEEKKTIKLCSLGNWGGEVDLDHPSTFETLAMDPEAKNELIQDLDRFVRRRDFYRRVGKAWKRGYLLYGPPGTGKSSLIAAMANYLKFDIYELDLATLQTNSELQNLLSTTRNRSILVIEDIDCSIQLHNRNDKEKDSLHQSDQTPQSQLTLSGLLNFIDGLWSCCGDERIIIFTTNFKDRLDPALLRPGRMDKHIHMSYCSPGGFRVLASNYHNLKDHEKFDEIDTLLTKVNVTPAEIAEELMKSEHADIALEGLITFLQKKKIASDIEISEQIKAVDDEKVVMDKNIKKGKTVGRLGVFKNFTSIISYRSK